LNYSELLVVYPFTEADDRPHGAAERTAATQAATNKPLHV